MKTWLPGAMAVVVLLSPMSGTVWAQRHGGGHRAGTGGHPQTSGTITGSGDRAREERRQTTVPRVVTIGPPRVFFSQPYYAFRARQHVGFGLYLGYPVHYPSFQVYANGYLATYGYYPSPSYPPYPTYPSYPSYSPPIYPYSAMPTYPSASAMPTYPAASSIFGSPDGSVTIVPGTPSAPVATGAQPPAATGGVSFEITPSEAAVFVDGVYVGTAKEFSSTAPPLLLAAGPHHFELRAQGYQTTAFDVDVTPGFVIPYQGVMQP